MVQPDNRQNVLHKPSRKRGSPDRDTKKNNQGGGALSPLPQTNKGMKEVIAHIESNKKGFFSIYVEEDLPYGIIGDGYSVEEAKEDFLAVYEASRADYKDRTGEDIEFSFRFVMDASAFLRHYKGVLSLAGLSHVVGINKAQLSQYVCGTRNPSPKTQEKIKQAITAFAEELSQSFA